jgi:hypothetical protein
MMMTPDFKVWLFGTSTGKSKKKIRLADDDFRSSKFFHVFWKKSPRAKWRRVTSDLEGYPKGTRSIADKKLYIELYLETLRSILTPEKIEPPKTEKKEIELPELPKEPRVTLTKTQFENQMARVILDELNMENITWTPRRVNSFIDKLWRGYSHAPHLIASEQFRRSLVTQEIKRIKDKEAKRRRGELEEIYRQQLEGKEVSLDAESVGGDVKVQFKEVFNTQGMTKKDEMMMKTLEDGMVVEKERQSVFSQVIVDYDESIIVSRASLFAEDEMASIAFSKVRKDIEKLFSQALAKGLFRPGKTPEYSFRILVPLVNANGEIPSKAVSKKGKSRSGHGFSTPRVKISSKADLKLALDDLFEAMIPALTIYIKLNNSVGFMISGFSIERIIR